MEISAEKCRVREPRMGNPINWRTAPWLAIFLLVLLTGGLYAQEGISELPGSATTPMERDGRRIFVQRCAVCHLPLLPRPTEAYGPLLNGLFERRTEERVNQAIMVGYGNMPGWQYTLSEEQVSNVVAYLRTFKD